MKNLQAKVELHIRLVWLNKASRSGLLLDLGLGLRGLHMGHLGQVCNQGSVKPNFVAGRGRHIASEPNLNRRVVSEDASRAPSGLGSRPFWRAKLDCGLGP